MKRSLTGVKRTVQYVLVSSLVFQSAGAVPLPPASGSGGILQKIGTLFGRGKAQSENAAHIRPGQATANANRASTTTRQAEQTEAKLYENAMSRLNSAEALKYVDDIETATDHLFRDIGGRTLRNEHDVTLGRTSELNNYMTNLFDRQSVGVAIVGPASVGKTQLSIGLAELIKNGKVPAEFRNTRIVQLNTENHNAGNLSSFSAGLNKLKTALSKDGDDGLIVIHFNSLSRFSSDKGQAPLLDEYIEAAQRIIGRHRVRIVLEGNEKSIEALSGISRLAGSFARVRVAQLTDSVIDSIVKQYAIRLQKETGFKVTSDELIQKIITRARVYYSDIGMPAAANLLLSKVVTQKNILISDSAEEIAITALHLKQGTLERELAKARKIIEGLNASSRVRGAFARFRSKQIVGELEDLNKKISELMQNFDAFIAAREAYRPLRARADELKAAGKKVPDELTAQMKPLEEILYVIEPEDLALIIHREKNVNLDELLVEHRALTSEAERKMKFNEKIFGQEKLTEAMITAGNYLRELRTNPALQAQNESKVSSILLLGPPGVGKTESAYALAEVEFGSIDNVLRYDMSMQAEKHAASITTGSPPGYAQADAKIDIVSRIKANPKVVVLLDEIEKAHRDVMNDQYLRILSTGTMANPLGEVGDFTQSIVVMTSNVGDGILTPQMSRAEIETFLETQGFKRAYFNRITEIVVVNPIGDTLWPMLFKKSLKKFNEELAYNLNYLNVSDDIIEKLLANADVGISPSARDIQREFDRFAANVRGAISTGYYKNSLGVSKELTIGPGDAINVVWDEVEGLTLQLVAPAAR